MLPTLLTYNLIFLSALTALVIFKAPTLIHASSAVLFTPVLLYFTRQLKHTLQERSVRAKYASRFQYRSNNSSSYLQTLGHSPAGSGLTSSPSLLLPQYSDDDAIEGQVVSDPEVHDINKRLFLKLIGSAGLTTFLFSLFTRQSHAAFFGSVPGPGTVAIKDTAGNKIDPAEKQPTDGYEITGVDDDSPPSYYGFLNKDGAWYIAREDAQGEFRYTRGSSNYSAAWDNRTSHIYDYFNNIF